MFLYCCDMVCTLQDTGNVRLTGSILLEKRIKTLLRKRSFITSALRVSFSEGALVIFERCSLFLGRLRVSLRRSGYQEGDSVTLIYYSNEVTNPIIITWQLRDASHYDAGAIGYYNVALSSVLQ